jgi:hypothetical protein
VTGVASFILLADIRNQLLRTLHLNFEGGDQRVFRVNDNVSRFPLKFKANRKLHLCALPTSVKSRQGQSKHSIAPSFRELYGCWLNIPSLPLIILPCEAVFRGDVDNQQHLAPIVGETPSSPLPSPALKL